MSSGQIMMTSSGREHRLITVAYIALLVVGGCGGTDTSSPKSPPANSPQRQLSADQISHLHNRGVGLMGRFDFDGAVRVFEELAAADPDATDFRVDLAIALFNRRGEGDDERAAALLKAAMQQQPHDVRAPYCRALLHFNRGETDEARKLFERVAQADPQDSYARYYVGQCLLSEGEYRAALPHFELRRGLILTCGAPITARSKLPSEREKPNRQTAGWSCINDWV